MTELSQEARHLGLDEEMQEPEPMQVVAEEDPEPEPERPEWLSPKYASVEEQAKAQAESERRMHEEIQARAKLEERLSALDRTPSNRSSSSRRTPTSSA